MDKVEERWEKRRKNKRWVREREEEEGQCEVDKVAKRWEKRRDNQR